MEFFERAHVTLKDSSKRPNKSEEAVKKQLKQMLHAYKRGNNQEIQSFADTEHKYDFDEVKSVSDSSDISLPDKKADTSNENVSSRISEELQSSTGNTSSFSNDSSSKSNVTQPEDSDSPESIQECEEFQFLSISQDISTTDKDLSSTFESSILSEEYSDSEISIPSSLQTSSDDAEDSDEEPFDPDGALASKILENLSHNLPNQREKRKLPKDPDSSSSKEKKKAKAFVPKEIKISNITTKNKDMTNRKVFRVLEPKDETIMYRNKDETSEESFQANELQDSQSSENSMQFISVSASDMQSQSLSDIVGDYVHPTVRNLPSEKQNIVYSLSSKYAILDEVMNVDNAEDISSLIPEIDEELAIEDLTLETDPQDPTEESTPTDTVQTEDYFEQDSSTDKIEPAPVPSIKVYNSSNSYILFMKHPAEIFIHGKLKVTVIGGSIEVFGSKLEDDSIDLYAPYCSLAQSIKTIDNTDAFHRLNSKLTSADLTAPEIEEIISSVTDNDAVIVLKKLDCPSIDFVENNFNGTELFTRRVDQTPKALKKVAESLGCSLYYDQPKRVLREKNSWEQVVACGNTSQSRGIICGGKGTGKSTFLRYLVNKILLTQGPVLVIDLDPGQAEFTMPGNISANVVNQPLIGPNFTHLSQPVRMLNIGMINTMNNPFRYISAVGELIAYCRQVQTFQTMPWIVNTMGMCNNMGLKFITQIISEIQPTFVYQIDSKIAKKKFELELQPHKVRNFYEEHMNDRLFRTERNLYSDYTFILGESEETGSPQKGNARAISPADERYLSVLAYFGQLLNIYGKNILDIVPYEVDMRNLNIGLNVKIPGQSVMKVINGKIIALCQLDTADKGKVFTLKDRGLLCHGYGLVRSIDFEKEFLYLLTPEPIEKLKLVNTLVYTDWMPELPGQETHLPSGTVVPYRTATVFHERRLMFPPRRRFNPIQLLKATRSA